jgi:hypothetical protein
LAVLNPTHLLDQAAGLCASRSGRKPRQVDLRRSVSSAYYAVFHLVLTALADEFVGKTLRSDPRYWLAYRSVDHRSLRTTCGEIGRPKLSPKFQAICPDGDMGQDMRAFADNVNRLQSLRHDADYNPAELITSVDALFAHYLAGDAILKFNTAPSESRKVFLTLLAFPPR